MNKARRRRCWTGRVSAQGLSTLLKRGCRGLTGQGWASLWSTPLSAFTPSHETSVPTRRNIYTSWSMQNSTMRCRRMPMMRRMRKMSVRGSQRSASSLATRQHWSLCFQRCVSVRPCTQTQMTKTPTGILTEMSTMWRRQRQVRSLTTTHSPYQLLLLLHTQVHTHSLVVFSLCPPEHGQGDIPSFCTYEEGVSGLRAEGQATLQRLEGMLAQSVANTFHMAGVRTDETNGEFDDGVEVDAGSTVAGQFEDADIDH
ncbi:uncharacterized protein LOC135546368 isoform X1 [Oncorhynchus masou masou]|uniref:uncharacterized protein LOC135546368 isoform X1 n=1 Tax=Oncorhynchus masou masou TaxID=90313 RepID=UPI0031831BA6